jgi:5S rRNA maturation endonuclease (ribonuclease M5)
MGNFKNFDEFLNLFPEKPRQRIKNGWNVLCPVHDDHNPSLSVSLSNHKILLNCKAGCQTSQILAALTLSEKDLYLADSQTPTITATYPYLDKNGQLLFEIVRYNPKTFKARRPDNNGDWVWNMQGITLVIYHLPDIERAITEGNNIYIAEGERDTDSLCELGLVATTNPFGAGKWKPEYSEMLSGAKVIIIPDNDNEGIKHAISVINSLEGKAKSLSVVEVPHIAKDITEWLKEGHSQEDFLSLPTITSNEYKNIHISILPNSESSFDSGQLRDNFGTTSAQNWGVYAKKFDEVMSESDTPRDKREIAETIGLKPTSDTFRKLLSRRFTDGIVRPYRRSPYLIEWINRDYKVTQLFAIKEQAFLNIKLPLDIESLVRIPPGSVIGVAGYVSSGKTAFLLETAELNVFSQPMPVYYWYNEMSEAKMAIRCEDFPLLYDAHGQKKFFPVKQGNFEFVDVLEPDAINLIDYLDRDEELFLIGNDIKQLQKRLNTGIVIFALQKPHGRVFGYGGVPSAKLANLYISLDVLREMEHSLHGKAEIAKCKDWVNNNPVGLICEYDTGGRHGKLFIDGEWIKKQKGTY